MFCPEPADGLVAIDDLQNLFARQGMAAKMGELGLACEDVDKLLPALIKNKGEAFGGFKKLTIDGAIYPLAF